MVTIPRPEKIRLKISEGALVDIMYVMGQNMGYPIRLNQDKLGFPASEQRVLWEKLQALYKKHPSEWDSTENNQWTKDEIVKILRSMSVAFIEIPTWEFQTILGFEKEQAEQAYEALDSHLSEFEP